MALAPSQIGIRIGMLIQVPWLLQISHPDLLEIEIHEEGSQTIVPEEQARVSLGILEVARIIHHLAQLDVVLQLTHPGMVALAISLEGQLSEKRSKKVLMMLRLLENLLQRMKPANSYLNSTGCNAEPPPDIYRQQRLVLVSTCTDLDVLLTCFALHQNASFPQHERIKLLVISLAQEKKL